MPFLATLALIQIQILFTMLIAWTSFSWLGLGAAVFILFCLVATCSAQDPFINRVFGTHYDRLAFRTEYWLRLGVQIAFACALLYGVQSYFPGAFAATWLNFTIPYYVSLPLSGVVLGLVSIYSQFFDIPSTFEQYADMAEF